MSKWQTSEPVTINRSKVLAISNPDRQAGIFKNPPTTASYILLNCVSLSLDVEFLDSLPIAKLSQAPAGWLSLIFS